MDQNKFSKALQTFDENQKKLLRECLETSLIPLDPAIKKFIKYALDSLQKKPSELTKEKIIQHFKLSSTNAYNNYIRKSNHYLKDFIPLVHSPKTQCNDFALLDYYYTKGLNTHFETQYKSYLKKDHELSFLRRSEMFLIDKYAVELNLKNSPRTDKLPLKGAIQMLDMVYWCERIFFECALLNRTKVLNTPYTPSVFVTEEILQELEGSEKKSPLLEFYLLLYRSLKKDEGFEELKRAFGQLDRNKIGIKQFLPSVQFMLNWCIRKLKLNDHSYCEEYLSIVDSQLKTKGLLDSRDELSPTMFKNIYVAGLRAKKVEWVQDFIKQFQKNLPKDDQEIQYDLALANTYLHTGEHDKISELIIKRYDDFNKNDPYEKLLINKILIQAILLEKDYSKVIDECKLFLRRIKRSGLPKNTLVPLSRFLETCILIAAARLDPNQKSDLKAVFKKLERRSEPVIDRDWLIELVRK